MDKPRPGLPTTEILKTEYPVIADLGDGWFLVAHPSGVGIARKDFIVVLWEESADAGDDRYVSPIPESVRAAAVKAFEKLAWPLVRDQFWTPTGKYTRPADLPGRVCRVLSAYTMYDMKPENGSLSDLVYRLTHLASGRCDHEGGMEEFEKLEEEMEAIAEDLRTWKASHASPADSS